MGDYKIKLTVIDDENNQISSITTSEYIKYMKEHHNINALDELLYSTLAEFRKNKKE